VSRVIAAVREPRLPPLTPERRARARAGLAAIAVVAAVLVVALAGARAYQQRRVSALIEDYNHDNFIVPVLADQRTEGSRARLVVDWPNQVPSEGPAALALVSTYLVVGVTCHGPADAVIWRVYRSPSSWSHPFPVRCSEARGDWRVFLPVYESGPSWRFQGIEWVAGAGIDVGILGRISDPRRTPLMLALTLPPDWREAPLYHRFSWDAIRTPQRW
jgi:hypothetical protein